MTDDNQVNSQTAGGAAKGTETRKPETFSLEDVMLEFLSKNPKIMFKSQQIDDPELTENEKKSIAESILHDSHEKFLYRFGKYLQLEHLTYFENFPHVSSDRDENINFLIKDIRKNLRNYKQNVRNRRFTAMKSLIVENSYFSEKEMMGREPYLYEKMVGQYLTDSEKNYRDRSECDNVPFSNVLLEGIDNERMEKLKKEQQGLDVSDSEDSCSQQSANSNAKDLSNFVINEEMFPRKPAAFTKQWGNFEDDEKQNILDAGPSKKHRKVEKFITGAEREILRKEFLEIMYSKFLNGDDVDFDYTAVDDNTELDDMEQIAQDDEDKYFDEDDSDSSDNIGSERSTRNTIVDTSEDELDEYMKHLDRNGANSMSE